MLEQPSVLPCENKVWESDQIWSGEAGEATASEGDFNMNEMMYQMSSEGEDNDGDPDESL